MTDTNWPELLGTLTARNGALAAGNPDIMKAFHGIDQAASKDGALSPKTKELLCLAIGISVHCEGCLAFHAKAAAKHGATREEVLEMIGVAIYMGGGPSVVYGAMALSAFDGLSAD